MTTKQIAAKYALTSRQAEVLALFRQKDQPTQAAAGKILGCSPVNICLLLKVLAEKGVLRRAGIGNRGGVEIIAN